MAATDIRDAVQKAVYEELVDADFSPHDPAIYDDVPQDESYPYVVIGESDWRPALRDDDSSGYLVETRIHVYSNSQGRQAVNQMLSTIDDTLSRAELTLDTGHVVTCEFLFSATDVETDGVVRSGRIDHRWLIGDEV